MNSKKDSYITKRLVVSLQLLVFCSMVFIFSGANTVNAEKSSIHTIYHVYINGKHIGFINNKEAVETILAEKVEQSKIENLDLSLQIKEEIEVIPEIVFHDRSENELVTSTLTDQVSVEAKVAALEINEETIIYLPSEQEAEKVLEQLTAPFVSKEDYESFFNSEVKVETEEKKITLEIGDVLYKDISFTKDVEIAEHVVDPTKVISVTDAVDLIKKGVLKETPYIVKEGDVLGAIANNHGLTTKELLDINKDLNEDSVINIGDQLNVTVYEPIVEVLTTKVKKVEEDIPFETEVQEDSSLWKGDQKVTQEGSTGKQVIEYEITEQNGKMVKREILSEEITEEPVKKIVVKGTKVIPSRGSGQVAWPAVGGYISSYQGNRWGRFHRGIDIARPSNYNILSADNGTVTSVGYQGGYGNVVRINHNNGIETLYAHLDSIDVSVGQTVSQGQKIGVMGRTGNSTGVHLHFEIYENGQLKNPMDYLNR
ncbi:peptidoglycan DD-metalloendopeptidase family protein [Bacillus suaedae]|uniref:M23 family metallopeptidase n=1 Tax=Halalkalibacter suaedae TaxID=2822140 RepID=A0A940WTT2_9BACI|nr:peptidoglycan DD-metalloendopeptidase family protein [Bacillus suaedae]MBP3952624.1 M23 family metallopeptidase [Bacillus suaedae]